MTRELADLLMEAAEVVGVDAEVRECAQGGKPPWGVVFQNWSDTIRAAYEAGRINAESDGGLDLSYPPVQCDSLGRSLILY